MSKGIKYLVFTALIPLLFLSCRPDEVYPSEPVIEFVEYVRYPAPGDSGRYRINFTDGEGDIGYPLGDTVKDLVLEYRYLDTVSGNWIPYYDPASAQTGDTFWLRFPYTIPEMIEEGPSKALKGEIYVFGPPILHYVPGHTYKYLCWIYDHAGHKSNVVESQIVYP